MKTYSFGIPAILIWSVHLVVAIYIIYLGNMLKNKYNNKNGTVLLTVGALVLLYHGFLLLMNSSS